MKTIFLHLSVLLFTLITNAQQANFDHNVVDKTEQIVHAETLMLQQLYGEHSTQILQIGDYNLVRAESQKMQVTQTGELQLLYYTETNTLQPSNMTVNMEGSNNYIEVYGNNSIMDQMTINVSGNDRSVTIRNY